MSLLRIARSCHRLIIREEIFQLWFFLDARIERIEHLIQLRFQYFPGIQQIVNNDLVKMEAGETMSIGDSGNVELEFVHVTHSIIDAINPVVHTPEGAVVYGLDKRMDHSPVLEDPIDMKRFREIGREGNGVLAFVELFLFMGILLLGLIYVWVKGDLAWVKTIGKRHPA